MWQSSSVYIIVSIFFVCCSHAPQGHTLLGKQRTMIKVSCVHMISFESETAILSTKVLWYFSEAGACSLKSVNYKAMG